MPTGEGREESCRRIPKPCRQRLLRVAADAVQPSPDEFVIGRDRPAVARRQRDDNEFREEDAEKSLGPDQVLRIAGRGGELSRPVEQHLPRVGIAEPLLTEVVADGAARPIDPVVAEFVEDDVGSGDIGQVAGNGLLRVDDLLAGRGNVRRPREIRRPRWR